MTLLWLYFNSHFEGKLLYYESGVRENIAYIKEYSLWLTKAKLNIQNNSYCKAHEKYYYGMHRVSSDKEDLKISLFIYIRRKGLRFFAAAKLKYTQRSPKSEYIYLNIHVIMQIWSAP